MTTTPYAGRSPWAGCSRASSPGRLGYRGGQQRRRAGAERAGSQLYQGDISGAVERFKAAGPLRRRPRRGHPSHDSCSRFCSRSRATVCRSWAGLCCSWSRAIQRQATAALEEWPPSCRPRRAARSCTAAGRAFLPRPASQEERRSGCSRRPPTRKRRPPPLPPSWPSRSCCSREGRKDGAISPLEHLILTYPESALVPQARRALDQARGAVPQT